MLSNTEIWGVSSEHATSVRYSNQHIPIRTHEISFHPISVIAISWGGPYN